MHFDTQCRNQDTWLHSEEILCYSCRLLDVFKIPTSLTFGAMRKKITVSTAFETSEHVETVKQGMSVSQVSRSTCEMLRGELQNLKSEYVNVWLDDAQMTCFSLKVLEPPMRA